MAFKVGNWVQHNLYGAGQVTEDRESFAVVQFISHGIKTISVDHLSKGEPPSKDFKFPTQVRRVTGRAVSAPKKPAYSFEHLVERFLHAYPSGFADKKFVADEREYKLEASNLFCKELSKAQITALLAEGDFKEIARRANARASRKLNLIFPNELMKLNDGLKDSAAQERFSRALYQLLYDLAEAQKAFEAFVTILGEMGCPKWTIATIYRFLLTRGSEMFMKPEVCKLVAGSVNISLNYDPLPNWLTYQKLQDVANETTERLKAMRLIPRDGIDVQSFMYIAWDQTS